MSSFFLCSLPRDKILWISDFRPESAMAVATMFSSAMSDRVHCRLQTDKESAVKESVGCTRNYVRSSLLPSCSRRFPRKRWSLPAHTTHNWYVWIYLFPAPVECTAGTGPVFFSHRCLLPRGDSEPPMLTH